jgi:hypothetical protein
MPQQRHRKWLRRVAVNDRYADGVLILAGRHELTDLGRDFRPGRLQRATAARPGALVP